VGASNYLLEHTVIFAHRADEVSKSFASSVVQRQLVVSVANFEAWVAPPKFALLRFVRAYYPPPAGRQLS
jgi:hypothetical protein